MNQLAHTRKRLGFSQEKLAEKAGISRVTVSMLENGYRPRRSAVCAALARALKVPESALFPPTEKSGPG